MYATSLDTRYVLAYVHTTVDRTATAAAVMMRDLYEFLLLVQDYEESLLTILND